MTGILVGCGPDEGDDKSSVASGCAEGDSVELGFDEPSDVDLSGADVVTMGEGEYTGSVRWADGTEALLDVLVAYDEGTVTYTEVHRIGDLRNDFGCVRGVLRVPVGVEVTSDDGRLTESWQLDLEYSGNPPQVDIRGDLTGLTGTLDPESFVTDPASYEAIVYEFLLAVDPDTGMMSGDITAWLKRPGADPASDMMGPDNVVYSERVIFAWIEAQEVPAE